LFYPSFLGQPEKYKHVKSTNSSAFIFGAAPEIHKFITHILVLTLTNQYQQGSASWLGAANTYATSSSITKKYCLSFISRAAREMQAVLSFIFGAAPEIQASLVHIQMNQYELGSLAKSS
jgi:hypothetical protein